MALDYKSSLARYRRYLQVMREQPLIQAGVWTALSLGLVIAVIVLALKPTLMAIAGLLGQIKEDSTIVTKLDDKIVKMQKASSELQALLPREAVLDEALPSQTNWDSWTAKMFSIASQSGVQVMQLSVGPAVISGTTIPPRKINNGVIPTTDKVTLPEGVQGLNFTITAEGGYDQLKQMVSSIEENRRLNILTGVEFSAVKDNGGGASLSANVRGVAAFMP